jgi:uncharacterized RDD family membrane protein YckC
MGLEIAHIRGDRVPFGQAVLRALGVLAGSVALGSVGLSALADPERRSFVDRLTGTEVIQRERS